LLLAACATEPQPAPPEQRATLPPDVVLVSLDTTRADRLGCYGHAAAQTPWLDALAARGRRFEQAYSPLPLTIPSHAAMMTGLEPYHLEIRANGDNVLGEERVTLAERLKQQGYQTAGSVAAFVTNRVWGFAQGFDAYRDELPPGGDTWHLERPADQVVDDALELARRADPAEPLFLWLHLYDPHYPYTPPDHLRESFGDHPYDGELAWVDEQLARLEQGLGEARAAQPGRETLWVVVGDHGEGLGEHRELTHGLFVYQGSQHVPWIMAGPGIEVSVVQQPVGLADLLPTLLDALGMPVPLGIDGRVQPGEPRPLYMECYQLTERFRYAPHLAVLVDDLKLIWKPRPELYRVTEDPKEKQNLAEQLPADRERLAAVLGSLEVAAPGQRAAPLDASTLARLEALGYIAGEPFEDDVATLPDPQDHLEVLARVQRSDMLGQSEDLGKAIELLLEVIALEPDMVLAHGRAARMMAKAGRLDEARRVIDSAVERFPEDASVLLNAAIIVGKQGDHELTLAHARRALELDPDEQQAADLVAQALGNMGRVDELEAFGQRYIAEHPEAFGVVAMLGLVQFDQGSVDRAEPLLRHAARAERPMRGVCRRLGVMARSADNAEGAERWAREEIEHYPADRQARLFLARVLAAKGDEAGAQESYDALLRDNPDDAGVLHDKALGLLNLQRYDQALPLVERGVAAAPEDADLALLMANLLKKLERGGEALVWRDKALELHRRRTDGAGGLKGGGE